MEGVLRRFLCCSKDVPPLATIRGKLFERMAHKVLQTGGQFKICKLVTSGEPKQNQEDITVLSKKPFHFDELCSKDCTNDVYLLPNSFLMTVSSSCTIHVSGLHHAYL